MVEPPAEIALDRRPIPEQIAEGLTALVLSGELPAGRPLHEGAIASDLGVSRNTVREAVRLLERSGLVRYESNRGAVVREPSPDNLDDVYRARLAVELGAVWAAETKARDTGAIDAALARLQSSLVDERLEAVITADLGFHAAIVAVAGSARLNGAFTAVLNELRLYLTVLSARHGREPVKPVLSEHEEIAWALTSASRQELATVLAGHIRREAAGVLATFGVAP